MMLKKCKKCHNEYLYTEYPVDKRGCIRHTCRLCKNEQTRISRKKLWERHPEKHEQYKKDQQQRRLKRVSEKKDYDRIRYLKHRDKTLKERRKKYWENPEEHRKKRMMCNYKISADEYEKLNATTKCECCGKEKNKLKKGLQLDHCHKTGKVRGMLCSNCNTSLGLAYDNIFIFNKLINYLEKHQNETQR